MSSARRTITVLRQRPMTISATALGYMDFEAAAKLSGARSSCSEGLARLERGHRQFTDRSATGEHAMSEINPPLLVRNEVMFGTGQLPKIRG